MGNNETIKTFIETYQEQEGLFVINRQQTDVGEIIGQDCDGVFDCGVEDCNATTYAVEWNDGKVTFVCGKGLKWVADNLAYIQ